MCEYKNNHHGVSENIATNNANEKKLSSKKYAKLLHPIYPCEIVLTLCAIDGSMIRVANLK
jgi:hypothetical protein